MRKVKPREDKGQKFGDYLDKSWNKTQGHLILSLFSNGNLPTDFPLGSQYLRGAAQEKPNLFRVYLRDRWFLSVPNPSRGPKFNPTIESNESGLGESSQMNRDA